MGKAVAPRSYQKVVYNIDGLTLIAKITSFESVRNYN